MSARDGLKVSVDSRRYSVDVEGITWQTISPVRPGSDQGASVGEQALSSETVWRRTRSNWILGAGQRFADVPEESDPRRFYESEAVDPWAVRTLTVLPTVAVRRASANANLLLASARTGGDDYLVLADGNAVVSTTDPESVGPTFTTHTGLTGTPTSLTSDGQRVWIATGSNIYLLTPAVTALTAFSAYDADVVGYANGRLLAANGAELVEVLANGSTVTLFTHPNTNFTWAGIVSSPGGIYCFGTAGQRSEVYVITAIDATGGLDVPFVAAEMPDGEELHAMHFYGGIMVMATSRGLRLAMITGGGFLAFGPVVDEPGEVRCLEPQGEDVWFGWTRSGAVNGLGRARLSRFTADLVPSFAADLAARGAVSGNVISVATVNDRRYFTIAGRGLYGETTTLEATATIDLGHFDYSVSEPKILDSISVWCDALPTGCSIVAKVFADDQTSTPVATLTINKTGVGKGTQSYSGTTQVERLRVVLTINQVGTTPVVVRRVTLRATPRPFIASVISLPLFLSDAVAEGNVQVGQSPFVEFTFLEALVRSRRRVTLTVGDWTAEARAESIEVQRGGLGGGNGLEGWADRGDFVAGKWDVVFVTLEPTS